MRNDHDLQRGAALPLLALLLACLWPMAATALDPQQGRDTARRFQDAIAARELAEGPLAAGLTEDLLALGDLYQHQGAHAEALAVFDRARALSRLHDGLYNEEQVGILTRLITSLEAQGEWLRAGEQHAALLQLQRRLYGADDPRLARAWLRSGRWHLAVFQRGLRRQDLGRTPAASGHAPASPEDAFSWLQVAQEHFIAGIQLLLDQRAYTHPDLLALEQDLIESYRLQAQREALLIDPDAPPRAGHPALSRVPQSLGTLRRKTAGFRAGEEAYERMLNYLHEAGAPPEQYADLLLGMADWYRLFGHPQEAAVRDDQARRLRAITAGRDESLSLLR